MVTASPVLRRSRSRGAPAVTAVAVTDSPSETENDDSPDQKRDRSTSSSSPPPLKSSSTSSSSLSLPSAEVIMNNLFYWSLVASFLTTWVRVAYDIRLHAIEEYGPIIHEFDPWFNFRATQYLYDMGFRHFFTWFDYKVWYPLGRPVGTTIYPGMQFTAVWIKRYIVGDRMSLNDVCCYMPAWFGAIASVLTGLLAYECSRDDGANTTIVRCIRDDALAPARVMFGRPRRHPATAPAGIAKKKRTMAQATTTDAAGNAGRSSTSSVSPAVEVGLATIFFMSMLPAHLMRSVGGGYDNESVAISAMVLTFYLWCRSLRPSDATGHYVYGALSGVAYFYMASTWGGYVFVLNMVGLHAFVLAFFLGRFTAKSYWAYTLFYVVGTALAVQIPVVGLTPLRSLEQLGPAAVFVSYQLLALSDWLARRRGIDERGRYRLRFQILTAAVICGALVATVVAPTGYFGPLSSRVRSLFVRHAKTGNPLVDSVAEHKPANRASYRQFLHVACYLAPAGFVLTAFWHFGDAPSFLLCYAVAAYFFSAKMVRLIVLLGPIASALGGIAAGRAFVWAMKQMGVMNHTDDASSWPDGLLALMSVVAPSSSDGKHDGGGVENVGASEHGGREGGNRPRTPVSTPKRKKRKGPGAELRQHGGGGGGNSGNKRSSFAPLIDARHAAEGSTFRSIVASAICIITLLTARSFASYSWKMSIALSNPSIVAKARTRDGQNVVIHDYLDAYHWLAENTPDDARILAWWDYGYQITGIANRTTIADGNTWNHEHIALLGKILTTSVREGHDIARHLADYVLLWTGGGGDDLAKSPHLARIANSVYRDHCGSTDPTCRAFSFADKARGTPSKMMERSFLYQLHSSGVRDGVTADPTRFKEVYKSKYGKVRIYQILDVSAESKQWVANPENRICDVEGGWFCRGQYPPALQDVLSTKRDFSQLEDFNRGNIDYDDEEYQKQYFDHMDNPEKARKQAQNKQATKEAANNLAPRADNDAIPYCAQKTPQLVNEIEQLQEKIKLFGVPQRIDGTESEIVQTRNVLEDMIVYMEEEVLKDPIHLSTDELSPKIRQFCRNEHELCSFWASTGHCKTNPWMSFHCAPVCGTCHLTDRESGYFRKLDDQMELYGVVQKIEGNEEEKYNAHQKIVEMVYYMQNEVFALDFGDRFTPEMRQKCRNAHELCAFWAGLGNCETTPDYMDYNCAPMCKKCDMVADLVSDECVQCQEQQL